MLGSQSWRHFAEREIARSGEREQADLAVEHGKIEVRATSRLFAPGEHRQDSDRHPQPGGKVGHWQAGLHRAAALFAGEAHEAAHRLEYGVVALFLRIRPALAESRAGDIDQLR